ncbi:MAG TPA: tripartite tricarboxylate transporter TctB family protein [Burkholderiales bacterium]
MSRRLQENIVAGAIALAFAAVIMDSLTFGPRARMVPLPLATFGLILTVIQIVWQNLRPADTPRVDWLGVLAGKEPVGAAPRGDETPAKRDTPARSELGALGVVAALVGLILLFGPIPAVFIFAAAYFLLSGHYSPLKGLVYAAAFTLTVYLLFVVALDIQLYHGVLTPLVERLR